MDDFSWLVCDLLDNTSTETNATTSGISQCSDSSLADDDQHDLAAYEETVDDLNSSGVRYIKNISISQ